VLETKTLALPKLTGLAPTLEGTCLKIMEECGELSEAIGKLRGLSGEKVQLDEKEVLNLVSRELMDVAQTAISMMFVLEEHYDVDLGQVLEEHIEKLLAKGYLK